MPNEKYSSISFCSENYKEYNQYTSRDEVDESAMYDDIKSFIRLAIKNDYQMKIWCDGLTVIIEYNHRDGSLSGVDLEWIGEDEYVERYVATSPDAEESNL